MKNYRLELARNIAIYVPWFAGLTLIFSFASYGLFELFGALF